MIKEGQVVDHSLSPCEEDFIPNVQVMYDSITVLLSQLNVNNLRYLSLLQDKVLLVYIKMLHSRDFTTWLELARVRKLEFVRSLTGV